MLTVQNEPFGVTADGKAITQYTLTNSSGLKVSLINLGGCLTQVMVPDRNGALANVNLVRDGVAGYEANESFFGGLVGRYANRIANAKFSLDGVEYELLANNGKHHLHGGKNSYIRQVWDSKPVETADAVGVQLSLVSPDGQDGYPGALSMTVTYTLNEASELAITYSATTDKTTLCNLTNHAYWNLAGAESGSVHGQVLTLSCDEVLEVDDDLIPSGKRLPVAGAGLDFTQPKPIGQDIAGMLNGDGYDHCFVVRGIAGELRPAAKVVDPKSGRTMEVLTTEPGIQLYTANHFKGGPDSAGAEKHGAFCLETQHFPDSPNKPDFPSTVLKPGQSYSSKTVHRFSVSE